MLFRSVFTVLVAALFAVSLPATPAPAKVAQNVTPKAASIPPMLNLRQAKARSLRKAKKACKAEEAKSELVPGTGIYLATCESWNVNSCGYFMPRVDKAWCDADFLIDDKFAGSFIFTSVTWKKSKTYYEPYHVWVRTKGPIYGIRPGGVHGFIRSENLG